MPDHSDAQSNGNVKDTAGPERWLLPALSAVILLSAAGAFYGPLLKAYLSSDDIPWIWFAATKSVWQILFVPEQYRAIIGSNFTPMLGLSYKIDWLLFGMEPWGYFFHNLCAVLLAAGAFFLVLRHYSNSTAGLFGAALFFLNPATLSVFGWSATRHYSEGLFFALLSLYLYLKSPGAGRNLLLSVTFYLVAALYKETYVVLPAILFLITKGSVSQRMRSTFFFWIVLAIYLLWRFWMLGSMGGYQTFMPVDWRTGAYRIAEFLPRHLFGPFYLLFWALAAVMFLTMRKKGRAVTLLFIMAILVAPIAPVSGLLDRHYTWARYIFHLSVFMIFAGVLWGRENIREKGWRRAVVVSAMVPVIALFAVEDNTVKSFIYTEREAARQTAREFLSSGRTYIKSVQPPYFYDWLRDIQEYFYGRKILTKVVPDDALLKYLSEERRAEIVANGYTLGDGKSVAFRSGVPEGRVEMLGYKIRWKLGPGAGGRYFILRGRYPGLYNYSTEVKREGEYIFGKNYPGPRPEVFYMKVAYQSPEGWEGVSDEYRIEIPEKVLIDLGSPR